MKFREEAYVFYHRMRNEIVIVDIARDENGEIAEFGTAYHKSWGEGRGPKVITSDDFLTFKVSGAEIVGML